MIDAMEHIKYPIFTVMYHPEYLTGTKQRTEGDN